MLEGWHLEPLAISAEGLASCIDASFKELRQGQEK